MLVINNTSQTSLLDMRGYIRMIRGEIHIMPISNKLRLPSPNANAGDIEIAIRMIKINMVENLIFLRRNFICFSYYFSR